MKKLLSTLILVLLSGKTFSQRWVEMMQESGHNFYEIQAEFNDYWKDKDNTEKGKGYKQFKRWEAFVEPRVYPSGDLSLISTTWQNFNEAFPETPTNSGGKLGELNQGNQIASTTWTAMGPFGPMSGLANGFPRKAGRDNFITFLPGSSTTYWCGAPAGGLWKTTNNGGTWTTNTNSLTVIGCSDLAVDPTNTLVMYLATGDGDAGDTYCIGVLKTIDGGVTWNTTGLTFAVNQQRRMRRLIINPSNTQVLLAATDAGIYRTANGGTSWTQINTSNSYDVDFNSANTNTVYAAGTTFSISTNGGTSFTQIGAGIPITGSTRMNIAVTPANSAYVYVLSASTANNLQGVYRSTDGGNNFTLMANSPNILANSCTAPSTDGQGWYDLAFAASPLNANEIVSGGVNIWRSTNGGTAWSIIGCWIGTGSPPYVHADQHELEYTSTGTLYSCNDGGVYQYTGAAWTDLTSPRNIAQIYKIGLSTLSPNLWITGHQDNGSNIYNAGTYAASMAGDGMDCFIDRTNNSNMYAEYYSGQFQNSTNGGASWTAYSTGMSGTAPWVSIWKQDPQTANTLWAGYTNMFKRIIGTPSWTMMTALPAGGTVNEFAIAPSNSLVIYVLKNGGIYKTINGGTSWTTITGTVPVGSGAPTFVTIDPTDPNNAWVTLSGYSAGNKVFMTTDGGTTWNNYTSNLPNLPANCSVYQVGTNDRIYVGMDVGVYYRDNLQATWTLYNAGLPNAPIGDMEISPAAATKLRAATYGRGVYEVDCAPTNQPPASSFTFTGSICLGTAKLFSDNSSNAPTIWSWSVSPAASINTPTSQNPSITFTNVGVYTVSLMASNGFGPGNIYSQTVSVIANPTVVISNSVQTICAGITATINGSGATTYSWNIGAVTNTVAVTPLTTTVYTLTGYNGTCPSAIKTATINVNPSPTVNVNSAAICVGGSVILTASGAATYSWNTGPTTSTISQSPTLTTVYTVTGTAAGCYTIKTATVTVNALPNLIANPSSSIICAGSSVTLTANGANTYTWQPGNLNGTPVTNMPGANTVYTVTGTDANGCIGFTTVAVTVDPCTGLLQIGNLLASYKVFPNPVNDKLNIQVFTTQSIDMSIEIYDAAGKQVLKQNAKFAKEKSDFQVNVSALANGVYYLKLLNKEGSSQAIKIVKD